MLRGTLLDRLLGAPGRAANTRLSLVTANFGGIDDLKPLPARPDLDAFYYTDAATLAAADPGAAASWSGVIVPDYPRHDFNPRLRGRYFKHQIHRLPEATPYRWLAWADASVEFHDLSFLTDAVKRLRRLPPHRRLLLIPHPWRGTVQQEYEHITEEIAAGNEALRLRYAQEKMPEQMAFFVAQGWRSNAPLWCGTLWLVENSPLMHRCWDAWWDQNLRFGMMDQLSLPFVLAQFGVQPERAEFSLVENPYFSWCPHAKLC